MAKRIGSQNRKTRYKFRQNYRQRGKISVSKFFQEFKEGEQVCLKINSQYQRGWFSPRFHGLTGTVVGKRGFCFAIKIWDQDKQKTLYVHPLHLMPNKQN